MFVRTKRQVFVSDKPENHINEGQEKKKSKSKEKERREKKLQWLHYIGYVFGRKQNCLMEEVYLTVTFSKIL